MGHQHIDWLEQFRDETTSSKERVRLCENDKKSNKSKTQSNKSKTGELKIADVVIPQSKQAPKPAGVRWVDIVRKGTYNQGRPASSEIRRSLCRL